MAVRSDPSIAEVRWQSGYFGAEILPYFAPAMARLRRSGGTVRVLVGSNDGTTRQSDVAALLAAVGPARPGLRVGVVSFADGYFHPKTVHLVRNDGSAAAYIGSANLTGAGAALNVEAGIVLDTRDGDDRRVPEAVRAAVDWWFAARRPGLHLVSTAADLAALARAGVLDVPQPPRPRPAATRSGAGGRGPSLRPLLNLPGSAPPSSSRPPSVGPGAPAPVRWTKKLSASDAQRKRKGNQRGSITLVKAGQAINSQTYFRQVLFGATGWKRGRIRTGKLEEFKQVRFDVDVLGTKSVMTLKVSFEKSREQGRSNYMSLLHLGPLRPHFSTQDMTGRQLTIERRADGTFGLSIR
jgi:hypothetical protein